MTQTANYPHELTELVDTFLADYFACYPIVASALGLHRYDGAIIDMRASAIAARVQQLRDYQTRLQALDSSSMGHLAAFDYGLLRWRIEAELWSLTEDREYVRNPIVYSYNAMVDGYIKRDYAPLDVRVAALTRHLQQIPEAMDVARQNLEHSLPRVLVEEAISIFAGLTTFLKTILPEAVCMPDNPEQERELWAARDAATEALTSFQAYLRNDLLPAAHNNFAIGTQRFADMLRYNELIDVPLDRLLALGEADLARNQQAIAALAQQIDPSQTIQAQMEQLGRNHPPADRLLDETRALLDNLRTFLHERDLITLPSDGHCHVAETPPFARWAFAMMDTVGPFEEGATDSFYYITLPEADWSPQQVEGWLTKFDYATLTDVSIHEAYPGHYIHFTNFRHAPSRIAKVFAAYSHYESWAHYVEQMMMDQGYGSETPHLRMAQLSEALVRNCRYICAIKMHTQGMSVAEATRFFMGNAYMDEVTASKEAVRGTHDPGYINYTLGKLLLLKLLEQYRAAQGSSFSLKRFHDEYIRYGAPPIPLLRRLLLPEDDGVLI